MSQQTGRLLLIKRATGTPGQYTTVCGFLARSLAINNNMVETTVPKCATPEDKVSASLVYGVQSMQFQGSGKYDNDAIGKQVAGDAFNQVTAEYQVIVPGLGAFVGSFLIESYTFSGEGEGNMDFECTFRMSGDGAFTAE